MRREQPHEGGRAVEIVSCRRTEAKGGILEGGRSLERDAGEQVRIARMVAQIVEDGIDVVAAEIAVLRLAAGKQPDRQGPPLGVVQPLGAGVGREAPAHPVHGVAAIPEAVRDPHEGKRHALPDPPEHLFRWRIAEFVDSVPRRQLHRAGGIGEHLAHVGLQLVGLPAGPEVDLEIERREQVGGDRREALRLGPVRPLSGAHLPVQHPMQDRIEGRAGGAASLMPDPDEVVDGRLARRNGLAIVGLVESLVEQPLLQDRLFQSVRILDHGLSNAPSRCSRMAAGAFHIITSMIERLSTNS